MFKSILKNIKGLLKDKDQINEVFIHPNIYRAFEIRCDPITTSVAIPFTPARGTEKVVDYILTGIHFSNPNMRLSAERALTEAIYKRSHGARITIPVDGFEYHISLAFEIATIW